MSELWGVQAGQSIARKEDLANQLAQVSMQKDTVEIEAAQTAAAAQKRMIELMNSRDNQQEQSAGGPAPPGVSAEVDNMSAQMLRMSQAALEAGLPDKAREYASTASTLRSQNSEIEKRQYDMQLKDFEVADSLMADVRDEESWQFAQDQFELRTGKPSPYKGMPYDPEVIPRLAAGITTAKERAATKAAEARVKASEAEVRERGARLGLIDSQKKLNERRREVLGKEGVSADPKPVDVTTMDEMFTTYYGVIPKEEMRVYTRRAAEDIPNILKQNPGMSRREAAKVAFDQAREDGIFAGVPRRNANRPGSITKPLPIPTDGKPPKENGFYQGVGKFAGRIFWWNGTNFVDAKTITEAEDAVDETESSVEYEEELE
jgi:hypothetical protein